MNKICAVTTFLLLTLLVSTPGCGGIEKYQERHAVMSSINDLKDQDPEVRLKAMELFLHHEDYQDLFVPALVDAIQDEDPRVRSYALGSLGHFKQKPKIEDVLPTIVDILRDPHETAEVKYSADTLLGAIGFDANDVDPIVIDLLLEQLNDEDPLVRSGAALALINITSIERAIQPLTEVLYDEDPSVRGRAAIALGQIGQGAEHAIPRIIELLNDEENVTRVFATSALEAYGPLAEDAIPEIAEAIVDNRIYFQVGSDAIGSITQSEDAIEMLIGWLNESEERMLRITASRALGSVGSSPGVVDALLQALSDSDAVVRRNAVESLGKTSPEPRLIDALITALDDEDFWVIKAAATSLGGFGTAAHKAIPKLREMENMHIQFLVQDEDGGIHYSDDCDSTALILACNAVTDAIDKIEGSGE